MRFTLTPFLSCSQLAIFPKFQTLQSGPSGINGKTARPHLSGGCTGVGNENAKVAGTNRWTKRLRTVTHAGWLGPILATWKSMRRSTDGSSTCGRARSRVAKKSSTEPVYVSRSTIVSMSVRIFSTRSFNRRCSCCSSCPSRCCQNNYVNTCTETYRKKNMPN